MSEQDNTVWMRINLCGAQVVIVGGGKVAARKARKFLRAGARVEVWSPQLHDVFDELESQVTWRRAHFDDTLPPDVRYVVAATNDATVNARIAKLARSRHIPVNVADASAPSTFHLPASTEVEGVEFSTFMGGASPALTMMWMARLKRLLHDEEPWWSQAMQILGRWRDEWLARQPEGSLRTARWRALTARVVEQLSSGASLDEVDALCAQTIEAQERLTALQESSEVES